MTVISIDGHPREEDLAAYVGDTLDAAECERLEGHVFECSVCARRLQRAASFQMVLHDAAAALEAEAAAASRPPSRARPMERMGRRVGAVSALWASAAAVLVLVCQPGGVSLEPELDTSARSMAAQSLSSVAEPGVTGCDPSDPRCSDGLLASVDPLQSIDPLSTWPDDPFTSTDWTANDSLDGEPCGSGEDGGPLVCRPFSG